MNYYDLHVHVPKSKRQVNMRELKSEFSYFSFPGNTSNFWYYLGALTTPPCHESAEWIIFQDTLTVSADQVRKYVGDCNI